MSSASLAILQEVSFMGFTFLILRITIKALRRWFGGL